MATDCLTGSTSSTKRENVTIFISTLSLTYYDRLIGKQGPNFLTWFRLVNGLRKVSKRAAYFCGSSASVAERGVAKSSRYTPPLKTWSFCSVLLAKGSRTTFCGGLRKSVSKNGRHLEADLKSPLNVPHTFPNTNWRAGVFLPASFSGGRSFRH